MVEIASHNDVVCGELGAVYLALERGSVAGGARNINVDYGEGPVFRQLQRDELRRTFRQDVVLLDEGGVRPVNQACRSCAGFL